MLMIGVYMYAEIIISDVCAWTPFMNVPMQNLRLRNVFCIGRYVLYVIVECQKSEQPYCIDSACSTVYALIKKILKKKKDHLY